MEPVTIEPVTDTKVVQQQERITKPEEITKAEDAFNEKVSQLMSSPLIESWRADIDITPNGVFIGREFFDNLAKYISSAFINGRAKLADVIDRVKTFLFGVDNKIATRSSLPDIVDDIDEETNVFQGIAPEFDPVTDEPMPITGYLSSKRNQYIFASFIAAAVFSLIVTVIPAAIELNKK